MHRQKEVGCAGNPPPTAFIERSSRSHVVDVGVVLKLASPGMQDAEESGGVRAYELGIRHQTFNRRRGCSEEGAVAFPLVATQKWSQDIGHSEGQHEVIAGQLSFQLLLEPLAAFVVLASWAMPVVTSSVDDMQMIAVFAVIESGAARLRAALDNRVDHLFVLNGHVFGKKPKILRPMLTKNVADATRHDQCPPSANLSKVWRPPDPSGSDAGRPWSCPNWHVRGSAG